MTIDEICDLLQDELREKPQSRAAIARCVLQAYEMGYATGREDAPPPRPDPFSHTNTWLAEMGFATWLMVLERMGITATLPATLEGARPEVRAAWVAAAAAIRRRVVECRLPVEETDPNDVLEEAYKKWLDT